jgi:hypothetical protein
MSEETPDQQPPAAPADGGGADSSDESQQNANAIVILAKRPQDYKSAEAFLKKREFEVYSANNIKDGMALITEKKAAWVLLSVNLPNANTDRIPGFLVQTYNVRCLLFGEDQSPQTNLKLSRFKIPVIQGKPSGPSIQTKIKNILAAEKATNEAQQKVRSGGLKKDEAESNIRISSKGKGDDNNVVIKSRKGDGNDSVKLGSNKDGDDDVAMLKGGSGVADDAIRAKGSDVFDDNFNIDDLETDAEGDAYSGRGKKGDEDGDESQFGSNGQLKSNRQGLNGRNGDDDSGNIELGRSTDSDDQDDKKGSSWNSRADGSSGKRPDDNTDESDLARSLGKNSNSEDEENNIALKKSDRGLNGDNDKDSDGQDVLGANSNSAAGGKRNEKERAEIARGKFGSKDEADLAKGKFGNKANATDVEGDSTERKPEVQVQKGARGEKFSETEDGMGAGKAMSETEEGAGAGDPFSETEDGAGMGDQMSSTQEGIESEGAKLNPAESADDPENSDDKPSADDTVEGTSKVHRQEQAEEDAEDDENAETDEAPEDDVEAESDAESSEEEEESDPAIIHMANGIEALENEDPAAMSPWEYLYYCIHHAAIDTYKSENPTTDEISKITRMAVIVVETDFTSGYVCLARTLAETLTEENLATYRKNLLRRLDERGITLTQDWVGFVDVTVPYAHPWAETVCQFSALVADTNTQTLVTFLQEASPIPKLQVPDSHPRYLQPEFDDIREEKPLPCDVYIHLRLNQKYFRYIRKQRFMTAEQKERFPSKGLEGLLIAQDTQKLFEIYYVSIRIQDSAEAIDSSFEAA